MKAKYIIIIFLIAGAISFLYSQTNSIAPLGSGTETDPYEISNLNNLSWLVQNSSVWDKYFIQTANIDASETATWDDSDDNGDGDKYNDPNDLTTAGNNEGWSPIGTYSTSMAFTGSYNGDNYTINGISITNRHTQGNGFFGFIQNGIAILKNLGLTNVDIRGENRVAGLAAVCGDNTIENCYVTGNITGEDYGGSLYQIGGLVAYGGWYGPTTISDCHNEASVTVTSNHKYAGGLLGRMINNSTVIRCYNTGDVSGGNNGIGGFIGYNVSCSISESYSTGNISGSGNNYGGFVGINSSSSTIKNCYSLGNITRNSGSNSVYGGFCGDNGNLLENCYSAGAVNFGNNNGFVSFDNGGSYVSNYFDSQTSSQSSGIGAEAKTTAEMQTQSTFVGWDFSNIWEIYSGGYPELKNIVKETEIISDGELSITIGKLSHGIKLISILKNATELLNISTVPNLFVLDVSGNSIGALSGWDNVSITNSSTALDIQLFEPINTNLFPANLNVAVSITVNDNKSQWDISVNGLNDKSLLEATYPVINIKAEGNDTFLRPRYSGQEIPEPLTNELNTDLLYPRGSGATMQFSAYYNDSYGIYLATHDPDASKKDIKTIAKDGGLEYSNDYSIPNKTVNGNDWSMPGYFALDLFEGDWYEAAQIYRNWVSLEAIYWPQSTSNRTVRQNKIGEIGAWAYMRTKDTAIVRSEIEGFHNMVGTPIGIIWYDWSQNIDGIDENYPKFLPEIPGMTEIVNSLEASGDVYIAPYTNGRLYDISLSDYNTEGYPYATKDESGNVYTQTFTGNTFAVMCPTQEHWQNTLIDVQDELGNRIGVNASYIDQVCHADPKECMDASHGHPLGGGNFWRQGYNTMFEGMHNTLPSDVFITSEGAAEFINNQVDGCYTLAWRADNLVPAYPAVYAGKLQTFGISTVTSEYGNASFYCKLAFIFNFGAQVGGVTTSIYNSNDANAPSARAFIEQLAKLRYKLKEFMSFGKMLKPLVDVSGISTITSNWDQGTGEITVTISSLQQSFWENNSANEQVVVFTNASRNETLNFTLDYTGTEHGFSGNLNVQKVTAETDEPVVNEGNSFTRNITLPPNESVAYIIIPEVAPYVLVETKIFLQGPYNLTANEMNVNLTLPHTSPYAEDARTVENIPADAVDWILVQLRKTPNGNAIVSKSAFLRKDGRIIADDGTKQIKLNTSEDNYYIVLKHRNHLSVMSSSAVSLSQTNSVLYDFTMGEDKFYGNNGAIKLK